MQMAITFMDTLETMKGISELNITNLVHFIAASTVPILCVDEAYSLLQRLKYQGKSTSQTSLLMERLCKCYEGDFWYALKGKKASNLLAFTTPQQFLESVWPKIVASKNGLAEMLLFFYQRRSEDLNLEAMAENSDSLDDYSLNLLAIYGEHNTTPELKYTLISTAKELFVKFSKPNEDDSQGAIVSPSISSASKKYKNNLGIALNMPVLYHQLTQEKIPKTHAW
ncbi:hypothetical protein pdam_00014776, partial [Pocillopora damicornis]